MNYFVLLNTQAGNAAIPLLLDNAAGAAMRFFPTEDEAVKAAKQTFFGQHFGFDVFNLLDGNPYTTN